MFCFSYYLKWSNVDINMILDGNMQFMNQSLNKARQIKYVK